MADPQADPSPSQSTARRRKPLKPLIEPGHHRQPSGRLGEIELLNDSHGDPSRDPRSLKPAPQSRWWFVVFALVLIIAILGFGLIFVASESTESPAFRERAEEFLSRQLQADVAIEPISASSFFFVHTPEIRISPTKKGEFWAIRLENVNFEIDRKSFTEDSWRFLEFQVGKIEVDLGHGPEVAEASESKSAEPSLAARLAESIGLGAFDAPGGLEIPSIRAAKIVIRGWDGADAAEAGFELEARASGGYENGILSFVAESGEVRTGQVAEIWQLDEFAGSFDSQSGKLALETASLHGAGDAIVEIRQQGEPSRQLLLGFEAKQIPITPSGVSLDPVFADLSADASGEFKAALIDPLDFEIRARLDLFGLRPSRADLFELLANQTGDNRLRRLTDQRLSGEIDWNPERLKLSRIKLETRDIARITGGVEIRGADFSGALDLEFPAEIIGRIPGGKPAGFSYPASGWSVATIQLGGNLGALTEDLSPRLLEQVAPDVTVSAAPLIDSGAGLGAGLSQADQEARLKRVEELFYQLIEDEEEASGAGDGN